MITHCHCNRGGTANDSLALNLIEREWPTSSQQPSIAVHSLFNPPNQRRFRVLRGPNPNPDPSLLCSSETWEGGPLSCSWPPACSLPTHSVLKKEKRTFFFVLCGISSLFDLVYVTCRVAEGVLLPNHGEAPWLAASCTQLPGTLSFYVFPVTRSNVCLLIPGEKCLQKCFLFLQKAFLV